MTLREAAVAALQASQDDKVTAARAALSGVLEPFDCSTLTVEHVVVADAYALVVFTDGDIHLGVRTAGSGWDVHLVEPAAGGVDGWTSVGSPVLSLAVLGELLPEFDPTDENAAPAWAAGVSYSVGDRVTYGGVVYVCTQAHTSQESWNPSAVPALWKVVA